MVGVAELFKVLRALRGVLLAVIVTFFFLSAPQQTWEIYRAIAQDVAIYGQSIWSSEGGIDWQSARRASQEALIAFLAVSMLVSVIFLVSRHLLASVRLDSLMARSAKFILPIAFLLMVFIAVAVGLRGATTPLPGADALEILVPEINYYFGLDLPAGRARDAAVGPILSALFSFNAMLNRGVWLALIWGVVTVLIGIRISCRREGHASKLVTCLSIGCSVGIVVLLVAATVPVALALGPLAIFCLFMATATVGIALVTFLADKHGVPYLSLLLLLALVLSALDLNDNHDLRRIPTRAASKTHPTTLSDALAQWYAARPDRVKFESRSEPYPLYIVAAQGGGIYAAFHAASWLGSVQDRCPSFATHLFAVSGVSGGSVGAAVFASLLNPNPGTGACVDVQNMPTRRGLGTLTDQADELLNQDLLAPLLAGGLFPDALQRFRPYPFVFNQFDRAYKFEQGLTRAAQDLAQGAKQQELQTAGRFDEYLSLPFARHWDPKGGRPALILNTTEAATGKRRVFAPFTFATSEASVAFVGADCAAGDDVLSAVSILDAAVASARFPWVVPPASLTTCDGKGYPRKIELVDGAYFENSGAATAHDLLRELEQTIASGPLKGKIRVRLIALTGGTYPENHNTGLSEAISPVKALLNTRTARGFITLSDVERYVAQRSEVANVAFSKVILSDYGYELPLGWRISASSMLLIRAQNGTYAECAPDQKKTDGPRPTACVLQSISRELDGSAAR